MTGDASLQVHAHSYFEVEDKRNGEVTLMSVMCASLSVGNSQTCIDLFFTRLCLRHMVVRQDHYTASE